MEHLLRIGVVDDHDLFREGLCSLLKKNQDFQLVGSFPDGAELIEFIEKENRIDVILLDVSMPKMDGFEVLKWLVKKKNKAKVIMISMHDNGNFIAKCARMGAHGYLLKNADLKELSKAIRLVANGKRYFSAEISEKMIAFMAFRDANNDLLTKKEMEVLRLMAKGLITKEIADQLFVSSRTIETHRANILKKMDVKNVAELIHKATQLNLI